MDRQVVEIGDRHGVSTFAVTELAQQATRRWVCDRDPTGGSPHLRCGYGEPHATGDCRWVWEFYAQFSDDERRLLLAEHNRLVALAARTAPPKTVPTLIPHEGWLRSGTLHKGGATPPVALPTEVTHDRGAR